MAVLDWLQSALGGGGDPDQQRFEETQAQQPGVLQHLKDILLDTTGRFSGTNSYDPNKTLAQNVLDPESLQQAVTVGMQVGPAAISGRSMVGHNGGPALETPKFPQYAEEYPPTGPPVLKADPKTGKEFLAKQLTPEALAFQKERSRIMADMNKNGYEPYFDPAQRTYVDPSNYPPANVDTLSLVPKKQVTIDQYMEGIGAPETAKALREAYDRGIDLKNADHWYAVGQLEKEYINELGPEAGRKAFLDEFAAPMAATTSGNNPESNLLMAHYLEYMRKRGLVAPTEGYDLPYPIGGRRGGTNLENYAAMREGGGYDYLGADQPKMHNFGRSFIGDLSRAVMDEQMAGGMVGHMGKKFADRARNNAFGLLERPVHDLAAELGVQPGNVQDVAWAGFKNEPGQPFIDVVNEAIERTHRLTGMPRAEIVRRGLVRKEIPLYGTGLLVGGSLADQN